MKSQWDCIRENLGVWQGSFTNFSPSGEVLRDTPSLLCFEECSEEQLRLVLTRQPVGEAASEIVREFRKPGPGPLVPFFETGAFCQGSTFWSATGQNGVELALTTPQRRSRLVLLYSGRLGSDRNCSQLKDITLIRETKLSSRPPSSAIPGPKADPTPFSLEDLLGTWEGESVSRFPDGRVVSGIKSRLVLPRQADVLHQSLCFTDPNFTDPNQGSDRSISSTARIEGHRLLFEAGPFPIQLLLLPGGASANAPLEIPRDHGFVLETGWLIAPGDRQRLMARYDAQGNWESTTLVQERKVADA